MKIIIIFMYCLLIYLLCIISLLTLLMVCGGLKLIYDCIKDCIFKDRFILGFINIKKYKEQEIINV